MKTSRCKKCGKEILWVKSNSVSEGKWTAFNKDKSKHFPTCTGQSPPRYKEGEEIIAFWTFKDESGEESERTNKYKITGINIKDRKYVCIPWHHRKMKHPPLKHISFYALEKSGQVITEITRLLYGDD